jgi:hypothetical protein
VKDGRIPQMSPAHFPTQKGHLYAKHHRPKHPKEKMM